MTEPHQQDEQLKRLVEECARLREENTWFREVLLTHDLLPKPAINDPLPEVEDACHEFFAPRKETRTFQVPVSGSRGRVRGPLGKGRHVRLRTGGHHGLHAVYAAKPEGRKRIARQTRSLVPRTEQAIREHLEGKTTIGLYPLLPDDTCWFLAVDFDKAGRRNDVAIFLATCLKFEVPAAVERSRSGNGAHVWIFFDSAVPAADARRLGSALLTRATESRHEIGLESYDASFRTRTRCPGAASGISSRCRFKWVRASKGTAFF